MVKLLFVVLHEKEQRLEVAVEDATGRKRRVEINWRSKELTPVPSHWFSMVEQELKLQDDEAALEATGRVLF
jgi:NADH:ubiquinone oxidoreductase subunit